jgi:hypothetical protein
VRDSQSTAIIAAICEADIEVTSGISHKPGSPYHSFTAAQMRQYFVSVWNVNPQAAEARVVTKGT